MISKELAQKIANQIMADLDYNINVMNTDGRIIASGESSRIGDIHQGALSVIKEQKRNIIYHNTATEKQGINDPIFIGEECVGVVGISGEPNEVMKVKKVVNSLFYFLISREIEINQQFTEKEQRQKFVRKLIYDTEPLTEKDVSYGKKHHFDFEEGVYVLVVDGKMKPLVQDVLYHEKSDGTIVILLPTSFVPSEKDIEKVMNSLFKPDYQCGVSKVDKKIHLGYIRAKATLQWSKMIKTSNQIINYQNHALYANVLMNQDVFLEEFIPNYSFSKNEVLVKTFLTFLKNDYRMKETAAELIIHRNTLLYRLNKMTEITGFDPTTFKGMSGLLYHLILAQ